MPHRLPYATCLVVAVLDAQLLFAQGTPPALESEIEMTYTMRTGYTHSTVGHYYRSTEGRTREDSPRGSIIVDAVRGTVTLLNPATKEARVIQVAGRSKSMKPKDARSFETFERGTQNGHRITKRRAVMADGRIDEIWTNDDLGVDVYSKVQGPDVTVIRVFRGLVRKDPPPHVFEIPSDYAIVYEAERPEPGEVNGTTRRPPQLGREPSNKGQGK